MIDSRYGLISVLFLASFLISAFFAVRGINLDQMIFYHAALRVYHGQLPYLDFELIYGPVAPYFLAFFFWLAPTGGWAILIATALLNSAATLFTFLALERVVSRKLATLGGVLTAIWFLPVNGIFYADYLGYFFVILAIFYFPNSKILPGFFIALAFLSKQPVGVGGLVGILAASILANGWQEKKRWFFLLLSFFATMAVVVAVLATYVSPVDVFDQMIFSAIRVANKGKDWWTPLRYILFPWDMAPWTLYSKGNYGRLAFYPVTLSIYLCYWSFYLGKKKGGTNASRDFQLAAFTLTTLFSAAYLGRVFPQLFLGTGAALGVALAYLSKRMEQVAITLVALLLISAGLHLNHYRIRYPDIDIGRPHDLRPIGLSVPPSYVQPVVEYLKDKPGAYGFIDDSAFWAIAAMGRAPTGIALHYQNGYTVPLNYNRRVEWQKRFIEKLQREKIQYFIYMIRGNGVGLRGVPNCMQTLPLIKKYLEEEFEIAFRFSSGSILKKR